MGLFMLSLPLTGWCDFRSPTLATALVFGGLCEYIIGIYDWYQGKTVLCFIDFIFGLLHLLIYYSFRLCEYEMQPIDENFESYLYGTFFTLYLVALLALVVACKDKGIEMKDFRKYLDNINIRLIVFINRYAPHENISADRFFFHFFSLSGINFGFTFFFLLELRWICLFNKFSLFSLSSSLL